MSKHTPGPWYHIGPNHAGQYGICPALEPREGALPFVAVVHSVGHWPKGQPEPRLEPHAGNANLIAAAPDLLAACKMVLDDPGLTASANDVIRAAIAKAEGTNG